MNTGAVFSKDRQYRYLLLRVWDETKPKIAFIGLNPSTADEEKDDPTIRRCISYAKDWGFGGLFMGNIFGFRSTDPKNLDRHQNPVGKDNDMWLKVIVDASDMVIAAWGVRGKLLNRGEIVRSKFSIEHVLGLTLEGQPKHPLYLSKDLKPEVWNVTSTPND